MKNYIGDGQAPQLPAPANVNSGDFVLVGVGLFGVAQAAALSAGPVALVMEGIFDLPKANAASTSVALGGLVYWDATNARTTISASSNTLIGAAMAAAANTDTTVRVRLQH